MKEIIEKLVSKHTLNLGKCKTLEDYAKTENNFTNELLKAINYSQCYIFGGTQHNANQGEKAPTKQLADKEIS